MNITVEKAVTIFKSIYKDMIFFSVEMTKKKANGTLETGYIPCRFKTGVDIPNQTKIYIRQAWLSFYKNKDDKTIPYIFINDFITVEDRIRETHVDIPIKEGSL